MSKKLCVLGIAAGLSLACITSSAAVVAKDGFYVGANGGYSILGTPRDNSTNLSAPDHHYVPAWGVYFGEKWALNPNSTAGWELGYNDNGSNFYHDNSGSGATLKIYSQDVELLATYDYLWSSGFNVFAKAGVAYQIQKANATNNIVINGVVREGGSNTVNQFSPAVALGAGYMINQNLDVYVSANYIYGDVQHSWAFSTSGTDYNKKAFEVSSLRLGFNYNF